MIKNIIKILTLIIIAAAIVLGLDYFINGESKIISYFQGTTARPIGIDQAIDLLNQRQISAIFFGRQGIQITANNKSWLIKSEDTPRFEEAIKKCGKECQTYQVSVD